MTIRQPLAGELQSSEEEQIINTSQLLDINRQPLAGELDLLEFFLVVIELKKGAFKTAYLGQLAAYLRVLDDDERLPGENPSVGIILCKDADKAYVEYVLQDYNKPMGVATYRATQERLRELLPPEEDMKRLMEIS